MLMVTDPRALLPTHKSDVARARALCALGYPAIAPVLREMLEWIRDCNWPVSHSIADCLASVGEPVVPLVWEVMRGTDGIWKFWCIHKIIARLPKKLAEQFRPELTRLMTHPTPDDRCEELDEAAREALQQLGNAGA
jgi:hypothetical protein